MKEYLLIWRALPKLLVGCMFPLELALLIFGRKTFAVVSTSVRDSLMRHFSGATLLVAVILLIVVLAGFGLFLLRVVSAVARASGRAALRFLPGRFKGGPLPLKDLFESPYKAAVRIFQERGDFYLKTYELKSAAFAVESLGKLSEIGQHWEAVKTYLVAAKHEDVEAVNFYSMLGQDRRTYEIIDSEIQTLEYFIVVSLLVPAMPFLLGIGGWRWITILVVVLFTATLLLPEIANRRRFLASFVLSSYLDLFTVHEGADVADREGEPYL